MCMARHLSWVLGRLVMHTWPDHKVHRRPLPGSLSMLHFTLVRLPWHLLGIGWYLLVLISWMDCAVFGRGDWVCCVWPGWLGTSLQWLGGPSSGHQREIIVLLLIPLYPYHALLFVLLPVLMFEYIYDVTTAINIFLTLTLTLMKCRMISIRKRQPLKSWSLEMDK